MLFKPEHIDPIIEGRKTQTRGVCRPGERLIFDDGDFEHIVLTVSGRLKWQVGSDYAVQPGRGLPSAWWCNTADGAWWDMNLPDIGELDDWPCRDDWRPLRIRLLDIRQERLQDISEADAKAEGVEPDMLGIPPVAVYKKAYQRLWNAINTRAGNRWADNPWVWALTFAVAR